jgi:AraC-like DNA-binding protein
MYSRQKQINSPFDPGQMEAYEDSLKVYRDLKGIIDTSKVWPAIPCTSFLEKKIEKTPLGPAFVDDCVSRLERLLPSPKGKDIKITTLAHNVGFGSLTAFHKTFKKYTGLTPNQNQPDDLGEKEVLYFKRK